MPGIKNIETVVDGRIPILQDTKTSYTVKSTTSLLSIGKSAFEAIEPFPDNCFFKQTPSLRKVLSCVLLGQRQDRVSGALREPLDEMQVHLIDLPPRRPVRTTATSAWTWISL
ncbi:hypothetical protein [Methylomonas sp. CM2]|uniref:hypothetical protein n=1 Tax=Methylomonas sp. CM2 TaxID=3417647 RepID=UPI003CFB2803